MGVRQGGKRRVRGFWAFIFLMLLASCALLIQRSRIRAHWWAWRLENSQNSAEISYFSGCLAGVGPRATSAVAPLLCSGREEIRMAAVWIMARLDDPGARAALFDSLGDSDIEFRAFAAIQLGMVADRACADHLAEEARRGEAPRAIAATLALEKSRFASADATLQELAVHGRFPQVRAQAIDSLGRRRSETARGTLVSCLSDETVLDGELLGELRDQHALAALSTRYAANPTPSTGPSNRRIRDIAAEALIRLTGADCGYRTLAAGPVLARSDLERLKACWTAAPIAPTSLPLELP